MEHARLDERVETWRRFVEEDLAVPGGDEEAAHDRQLEIGHETSDLIMKIRKLT